MKIKNKNIELEVKNNLINSIVYKEKEILNTTKQWTKKFPILYPAIGRDKTFNIKNKEYSLQKHGFWNELKFDIKTYNNSIILESKIKNRKDYPFEETIKQVITIDKNIISLKTKIEGDKVPMHFGYHPAFNIDKADIKLKSEAIVLNKDFTYKKITIDVNNIYELPWQKIDTFIFKQKEMILKNKHYSIKVSTNMEYIAIWTNGDKYVCLEPWSNLPATIDNKDNSFVDGKSYDMDIEIF